MSAIDDRVVVNRHKVCDSIQRARRNKRKKLGFLSLLGTPFACALLVFVGSATAQQADPMEDVIQRVRSQAISADPNGIANLSSVRAKAAARGRPLRIIARLSPAALERGLVATGRSGQASAAAVAAAQRAVVPRLQAIGLPNAEPLGDLPLVVLDVDAAGLDRLASSGEVDAVFEDEMSAPSLAETGPLVRAPLAWASGATGVGQTVAVLDTGVSASHPFLAGQVVEEACFSTNSAISGATSLCPGGATTASGPGSGAPCTGMASCDHGTHVAGIAAGSAAVSPTFKGMAPSANVFAVQVFSRVTGDACAASGRPSPCVLSFSSDQIRALSHVYGRTIGRNIVAVNMSLGSGRYTAACDGNPLKPLIDSLLAARVATVISSGNSGYSDAVGAPACISSAVTVGRTNNDDTVYSGSNSSTLIDLLAPGTDVVSSVPGGGYSSKGGTSMAAPHVAGAFAAIRSRVSSATVPQMLEAMKFSGRSITDPRNGLTQKRLDLAGALASCSSCIRAVPCGATPVCLAPAVLRASDGRGWTTTH